ncbi:unnamed protein product [Cylicocyclus nassatus]|uniref:Uncharacterized protein n=1 Tax=Cylicocyclus nassatus TaxID=53992 RepID=A0AA36M6C1_CYLNA|nr:unnamed protein product [Cylicocyclus nassatus]
MVPSRKPPPIPPRTFDKHDLKNTTFTSTETPQIPPPVPPRKPAQNRTTLDSEEMVLRPIMPKAHWVPTLPLPMLESQSTRNADPQLKAKCDKQCPGQQPQCMIVCLNGGIRVVLRRTPENIIFN